LRQHEIWPQVDQVVDVDVEAHVVIGALTEDLFVHPSTILAVREVVVARWAAPAHPQWFRSRVEHHRAMEDRSRWWVFDRPLWRDPLFVIGTGVGLISVVSVILLRDEYGTGAFVFALLTSLPAGVFASGVVFGIPREYMRGRRQRTP
jgi:hypothetical protein